MTLYVGTSGWAYKEWKPDFYPPGIPQSRWLEHYSGELGACEVNATFYRVPSKDLVDRWATQTADHFRFAFKAHRMLTYAKAMAPEGNRLTILEDFLNAVGAAGMRVGSLLFQFPPTRQRDDHGLAGLLDVLPARCALEFRHDSWDDDAVRDAIAGRGCTVCISDTTGDPPAQLPPGPLAYIRMRAGRYTPEQRDGWRELLEQEGRERDVFAFVKHEGVAADDPLGGVGLAQWLTAATREGVET